MYTSLPCGRGRRTTTEHGQQAMLSISGFLQMVSFLFECPYCRLSPILYYLFNNACNAQQAEPNVRMRKSKFNGLSKIVREMPFSIFNDSRIKCVIHIRFGASKPVEDVRHFFLSIRLSLRISLTDMSREQCAWSTHLRTDPLRFHSTSSPRTLRYCLFLVA